MYCHHSLLKHHKSVILISAINQIILGDVKSITGSDNATENYQPSFQLFIAY